MQKLAKKWHLRYQSFNWCGSKIGENYECHEEDSSIAKFLSIPKNTLLPGD
jgi:hypothetical protein